MEMTRFDERIEWLAGSSDCRASSPVMSIFCTQAAYSGFEYGVPRSAPEYSSEYASIADVIPPADAPVRTSISMRSPGRFLASAQALCWVIASTIS